MNIRILEISARHAVVEIDAGGRYTNDRFFTIRLNGEDRMTTDKVVVSIYDLVPSTPYELEVINDAGICGGVICFTTKREFVTLNVKDFGAKGDGVSDDTTFIQAAILACPPESRVLIPKGRYLIRSLFLKSDISVELTAGAELVASRNREDYPVFNSPIPSFDEEEEYIMGTWEGSPMVMYAGIITGINVSNVLWYGEGIINGNATFDDWWKDPKNMKGAYRPRTIFLNCCSNVRFEGVTIMNSPSWTIHPFFCKDMRFYDIFVKNPKDSPNTDGLDPESCDGVEIAGVRFCLGDDCIAVKSGKIYMGRKYKTPSQNIIIRQCLMEDGHGAVTMGSETAGGIRNVRVERCRFSHTDRGLRIKTRRGRGKDSVTDWIVFRDIVMDNVLSPFTLNCFYFCDPDGKSDYVQTRDALPVDDGTPFIGTLIFEQIEALNCHVCATYMEGLPEKKVDEIVMRYVHVTFADEAQSGHPIMSCGVDTCSKKGIFMKNIRKVILEHVDIEGTEGEPEVFENVDEVIRR